ncbi:MAG: phosphatidylglycerophosphatase A, partial [Myxococcota bacterium]
MTRNKPKTKPKLESARDRWVIAASSSLGLGLIPVAPGTWGTLGAFPIWWALSGQPAWVWLAVCGLVSAFAIWISALAEPLYGAHDVSAIVIDEVAGMLVCVMFIPLTLSTAIAGFVVFRVFDIVKPPPVRWF